MDPRNSSPSSFIEKCSQQGIGAPKARRILGQVMGLGNLDPSSWRKKSILSKQEALLFSEPARLVNEKSVSSRVDQFQKILFRTLDGLAIETVLIPLHKEKSVTVCLSSQVGCVMGCDFCATARMKNRRNLKVWEIVDQYIQAREILKEQGRTITGVVFMGMGEPFLNYQNVMAAAELFSFPVLHAIRSRAITVSTVGVVDKIHRFTKESRPYRLSISLGAAFDKKRELLVPVAAKTPIRKVMAAARQHALARKERVMLSYVCIAGVNVGEEDAIALGELIGDTPVRLDLIEVTDETGKYKKPSASEMSLFRDALRRYVEHPVVRRYSGGADIQAACGALAGE